MIVIICVAFCIALYIWTVASITYGTMYPMLGYTLGLMLVMLFVIDGYIICSNKRVRQGVVMLGVFLNLRLSISYCTWTMPNTKGQDKISRWDMLKSTGLQEVVMVIGVFVLVSLLICHTKIYRIRALNVLLAVVLPMAMVAARLTGKKVGGSYLTIFGVMLFGLVLAGFPFVTANLLTMDENRYVGSDVKKMPWNLALLLLYEGVLFLGCAIVNEYGLLLVIGITGSLLFWLRCKSLWTKVCYSVTCMASALFIALKVGHISQRFEIMMDPVHTLNKKAAETVLYLFRNLPRVGFWGNSIGDLPRAIYRQLDTDHVTVLLMNDYSVVLALLVIILMMLFGRWMFKLEPGLCSYDRYLNLTAAIVFSTVVVMHVASNLGSFITAGVGMPFISRGSVNVMYGVLAGIHAGLLGKEKYLECYEKEEETEA